MKINDKIYGKIEIQEPILIELLKTPSVLRLKKISQFGVPNKYYHFKNYSRYEHSVGVMILLKKLGTTTEEQVAGILHDVSVLTFSHVMDWVFSSGSEGVEDYHDLIHNEFVEKTEIPQILKKYNFKLNRILNEKNFTLLERDKPELCADRIDYALREFKYWLNPNIVKNCIKGLANYDGRIVFLDKEIAFDFAINYLKLQTKHWAETESIIRYYFFSEVIKIALKKKILAEKDFYKDESFVLNKIEKSSDNEIKEILMMLKKKNFKKPSKKTGIKLMKKFRYVDPKVLAGGKLVELSEINSNFRKIIDKQKEVNKKGITI